MSEVSIMLQNGPQKAKRGSSSPNGSKHQNVLKNDLYFQSHAKRCQKSIWKFYTAISYRVNTWPEQGFPCVVNSHRKKPVSLQGTPVLVLITGNGFAVSAIAIIKGKGHRKGGSWDSLSNNLYKKK